MNNTSNINANWSSTTATPKKNSLVSQDLRGSCYFGYENQNKNRNKKYKIK